MPTAATAAARRPFGLGLLAAVILLIPAVSARSQAQTGQPAGNAPVGVRLQAAPTRLDALDMSVFLPEGAIAETTSFGANATMGVELPDALGVLVVKGQKSTDTELTVTQVVDSMIEQLKAVRGVQDANTGRFQTLARLESRESLRLSGLAGERFYMRFPPNDDSPAMIRGVSVFQSEPGRFIVFDLMTPAGRFDESRRVYETVVGTMDVTDRDAIAARRAQAVDRMKQVLGTLTPEELDHLASTHAERWERLFTPARSGDDMDATEHGYRRVRVRNGHRGEVSGKRKENWTASERAPGLIVQLDAMALEGELRIDTRAVYFVTDDLNEEAWTVRMALRREKVATESSITGARTGTSMTIQLEQSQAAAPTVTRPVIQGDGYIPQAVTHLLARVLAARGQTGEFAGYAYNPTSNTVSLRWDTVEQPADRPGLWIVRSRPDENTPATTHLFNAQGELMRSELHNGRIWEPIELDRLVSIWKRKGLPLE